MERLRQEAAAFARRTQQVGRRAPRDPLPMRDLPASESEALHRASLVQIEQEAETHRARLIASVDALRQHVASTVHGVRERVSPDALRQEARSYADHAKGVAMDAVADRVRRHPFGAVALGAGVAWPILRLVRAMPTPFLLTAAGIASLSRGEARNDRRPGPDAATPRPGEVPPRPATPSPSPDLSLSHERQATAVVRPSRPVANGRGGPAEQVGAMARVRNDVLVRAALDRPAVVGAATVALGVLLGSISSGGAAERKGRSVRPRRVAEARGVGGRNVGREASKVKNRSDWGQGHDRLDDLGEDSRNGGSQDGANADIENVEATAPGPLVTKVVSAMVQEAESTAQDPAADSALAVEVSSVGDVQPLRFADAEIGSTQTAILVPEKAEAHRQASTDGEPRRTLASSRPSKEQGFEVPEE